MKPDRGAICDLHGEIRARQDVETAGADIEKLLDAAAELRQGLIASLKPELDQLRACGFHLSDRVYRSCLAAVGE